jgi:uncharacterized protein involved in outer membrane biogenesis
MNASDPNPSRSRRTLATARLHPWRTALALLLVAIVALMLLWDWNWLRGPIERMVQAKTGRVFDIGGDLDVELGRTTRVRMDAVRFGNADWSKRGDMAASDRVEFAFELFPAIFRRDFRVPDLRLTKPRLNLERGPDGKGNWVFGTPGGKQPQFRNLWVDDGRFKYVDAKAKTDVDIAVASKQAKAGGAAPIAVDGKGHWKGSAFTLEGSAESPLALRDTEEPYRIDLRAVAGPTRAHARGTLLDPLRFRDFDLKLALSGQNMDDLYDLIGVALPDTPPYALDGKFTRTINSATSSTWMYDGFSGSVGDSDLAGLAHVTTGDRKFFKADLRSKRLDFDDLAGFIGAAPQAGGKENTNPELQAKAAQQAASPRLLPSTPYELDKLRAMDADVRLRAARLNAPALPLDDMDAHLFLKNGVLRLDPLNFGVAGGDIRSTIRMNASESPIRTNADIALRGLNLGQLVPDTQLAQDAVGKIGGNVKITGTGNSIAAMLGSADGDIALGMGRGQISNLLMELAGLDIAEALKFMITEDRKVPIRCAFGDFAVSNGVMETRSLAFDTSDTIIVGEGQVNLRNETLDLRLRPRPKDRSLFALRSPLLVGGTFKDPSFRPDLARVGLRGAIALALGSIAPPAALLATLELGPGEDSGCGGKYAK